MAGGLVVAAAIAASAWATPPGAPSDPASTGQWSSILPWPGVAVHAHLLPTGDVLTWTDFTDNAGGQIWHPATGTFTPTSFGGVNLFCAGHSFLADGRLLVVGGIVGAQDDVGPRETTIFDPAAGTWTPTGLTTFGRYYPTSTTLPDGRVLVQGGTTTCGSCVADRPEIYDPATGTWTPMSATAARAFRYYPHAFVLPDGRVLVAGENDKALDTAALDLATQTWAQVDPSFVDGHSTVMYAPGKLMKSGTATADDEGHQSAPTTYVLDMAAASPAWQAVAPMAQPRAFHNLTLLPDGQVLVTGGGTTTDKANASTAVLQAELWSPTTKTWSTMASAQTPRLYHSTALLLPDGRVLVAGGGRTGCTHPCPIPTTGDHPDAELFSPPYLFKGARPAIGAAPASIDYGADFTVETADAARIVSVSLMALGSVTHSFNENQRRVPLSFEIATGSLTVHGPSSGAVAPPGPYMLFLVDEAGVPSVASMIRVAPPTADGVPPTAPSGLQGTAGPGSASLAWAASSDNVGVVGYDVHRSTVSGFTPTLSNRIGQTATTSFADGGLSTGTYFYRTLARDAAGNLSAASNEAAVAVTAPSVVALVQHAGTDAGNTTLASLAFPQANAAGNWIAVSIRAGNAGQTFTVSDARGNTYRKALQLNETVDTVSLAIYYAESVGGGPNTVTVSDSLPGGSLRFAILEFSGVAAASSLDGASTAQGNDVAPTSGSITTTAGGDLVLGALTIASEATVTPGAGFTIGETVPPNPAAKLAAEHLRQGAPGPVAAMWTLASAQPWGAGVAAFRSRSSAPPPVPDGTFGTAMTADRGSLDGSTLVLHWDVGSCSAAGYKAIYGPLDSVSTYAIGGAACGLGTTGQATWTEAPPGDLWFEIVATDGAGTEGTWGVDGSGAAQNGTTASDTCGDGVRANSGSCP